MNARRSSFVLSISSCVVFLASCDNDPVEPEPCTLVAVEPSIAIPALDRMGLESVLGDAAGRLGPALAGEAGSEALGRAIQEVAVRAPALDAEAACDAFNRAAAEVTAFAASAPVGFRPDVGALRLALGVAHAWLSKQSQGAVVARPGR